MKFQKFKLGKITLNSPRLKKAMIIALPVAFALVAAVSMALLLRPDAPEDNTLDNTPKQTTPKKEVEVIAPVETTPDTTSKGLQFISNSNGTCTLVGLGSCADRIVNIPQKSPDGDVVTKIGDGAFASQLTVYEICIPDSVISIGSGAFSGCANLIAISVGDANPMFSSEGGVLYNKSMSTLICYPSGKTDKIYVLPRSLTRIGEGAFASCPNLTELKYVGTKSQWSAVYISEGNTALDRLTVTCTSADK